MRNITLIGAITGDIVGSIYEFNPTKDDNCSLMTNSMEYTDDSILTIAVADWILHDNSLSKKELISKLQCWGRRYNHPMGSYGNRFYNWLWNDNPEPYRSWGNGSAMRVSAVGFAFETLDETLEIAKRTAEVTHNHPEGIKGAQATAAAIFLARKNYSKEDIRKYITETFGYDLSKECDDIRDTYSFEDSCQQTVPQSILAFLDSKDYEDAIRLTVSLGGDADTMGTITGAIAATFYKEMPDELYNFSMSKLPEDIKQIVEEFSSIAK